jgi:hypothetical protein
VAVLLLLKEKRTRAPALFLLAPAVFYFLISTQSALNIGYRHLLPMLPFLFVLISGLASIQTGKSVSDNNATPHSPLPTSPFTFHVSRFTLPSLLVTIACLSLLIADFAIHPHYLSYFNAAVGGPANGYNILIDSNIDWGQDLLRLKAWMIEHDITELKLGWFGTADPDYYGLKNQPLPGLPLHRYYSLWGNPPFNPAAPEPGIYAISVSSLWELPLPAAEKYVYPWFRARPPDDRVGYSIFIYRVP